MASTWNFWNGEDAYEVWKKAKNLDLYINFLKVRDHLDVSLRSKAPLLMLINCDVYFSFFLFWSFIIMF